MTSFQRDLVLVLPRIFGISGTLLKRPSIVQFDPCGPSTFDLTQKLYSNFISSFPTYAVVFNFIFFPTRAFFPTSFQVFQLQTFLAVYFTIYSNFCVVSVQRTVYVRLSKSLLSSSLDVLQGGANEDRSRTSGPRRPDFGYLYH